MPQLSHKSNHTRNNILLGSIFHEMADCYRYLGKEEYFRANAYENASRIVYNMKDDIAGYASDVNTLDKIGGIGESIAEKIIEYLHTGKIKTFEQLKKKLPFELLELMNINGFGPATLKVLHEKLGISNRDDLIKALESGQLTGLKNFGAKKIGNMERALKVYKEAKRLPLKEAAKTGNALLNAIRKIPGVQRAELAGSLRRKKETIGDIDIVVLAEPSNRKKIISSFIKFPEVEKVLAKGTKKASVVLKYKNVQVDIRLVHDYEYGAAMLYFTGSKEHNIKLRTIAKEKGYKINEYGIFDITSGKRLAGSTEEEMYHFLKMRYIPPEQRLNKGEIEKAMKDQLNKNGK